MIKNYISIDEIRVVRKSDQRGLFTIQKMPGVTMDDAIRVIRPMLASLSEDYEIQTVSMIELIESPSEINRNAN